MAEAKSFSLTVTILVRDQVHAEAIERRIIQTVEALQNEGDSIAPFTCRFGRLTAAAKEIRGAFRQSGKTWFVDCENTSGDIETAQVRTRGDALEWLASRDVTQIHEGKRLLSTRGASLAHALAAREPPVSG